MLANIVIPTHKRKIVLDATLRTLAAFFEEKAREFNVIIVDSSPDPNCGTREETRQWGGYVYLHEPGLHPFRKPLIADQNIDNDLPVLYGTDDDLFGYTPVDISDFIRSGEHYSACQYLMFRRFVLDNGKHGFHFWQGNTHFATASSCSTPFGRLKLFAGEGLACFYGLLSNRAFKVRAWGMSALMDAIGDTPASNIVEDLTNLATLCLSWHRSPNSWCFRFLDRDFHANPEWRGSWRVLSQMQNQDLPLLKRVCSLLARWMNQNLDIGSVSRPAINEDDTLQYLVSHTEGYHFAHSRKWRKGRDYLYIPGVAFDRPKHSILPQDQDRPFFIVPRQFVLSEVDELLFEGEWVCSANARCLFHAMVDNAMKLNSVR